jgi:hypothetical protein
MTHMKFKTSMSRAFYCALVAREFSLCGGFAEAADTTASQYHPEFVIEQTGIQSGLCVVVERCKAEERIRRVFSFLTLRPLSFDGLEFPAKKELSCR